MYIYIYYLYILYMYIYTYTFFSDVFSEIFTFLQKYFFTKRSQSLTNVKC